MAGKVRTASDGKPRALALPGGRGLEMATDELYEAGYYDGMHYETASVRVGGDVVPGIRSTNDDREVLGEVARQLVIAGILFRLVKVR